MKDVQTLYIRIYPLVETLTLTIAVVMETLPRLFGRPRTHVPLSPVGAIPVTTLGPVVAPTFTGSPLGPRFPLASDCGVELLA